jgi:hypothetical protein
MRALTHRGGHAKMLRCGLSRIEGRVTFRIPTVQRRTKYRFPSDWGSSGGTTINRGCGLSVSFVKGGLRFVFARLTFEMLHERVGFGGELMWVPWLSVISWPSTVEASRAALVFGSGYPNSFKGLYVLCTK